MHALTHYQNFNKEILHTLPLQKYQGVIYVIHNQSDIKKALKVLQKETVLGFDTETRPSFKKGQHYPPALLQLASAKAVYLFPLHTPENLECIVPLLSNPNIIKAGVAINDDIRHLQSLHTFAAKGFIDVSHLSRKLGVKHTGLRNLAGIFLQLRISKTAQTSNWARLPLTLAQINYAATDAWVSRELYMRIHPLYTQHSGAIGHSLK